MQQNAIYAPTMAALQGNLVHPSTNITGSKPPTPTHQHSHPHPSIVTTPVLTGRVFARQQLFATLPTNLQEDTKQFRAYVEQDATRLFQTHHHVLKSVYSVKGKELVDAIIHWLQARYQAPVNAANNATTNIPEPGLEQSWQVPNGAKPAPVSSIDKTPGVTSVPAPTPTPAPVPAPAPAKTLANATPEQLECAKQVAEALVLSGFLTPYKDDDEKHLTAIATNHFVNDSELLVPVAPSVAELNTTTSVWSVLDGAVYARAMKRKSGLKGKFGQGKNVYVLFNDKTKKLHLFASDVAREPLADLYGPTFDVQFDNSCFEFGVRVSHRSGLEREKPQFFNAESESVQLEFLLACINIGASYAEGNVRKLLDAYESRLLAHYGLASAVQVDQSHGARDAAMAGTVVNSISGLGRESYLETVEAPAPAKHVDEYPVGAFAEPATAS